MKMYSKKYRILLVKN